MIFLSFYSYTLWRKDKITSNSLTKSHILRLTDHQDFFNQSTETFRNWHHMRSDGLTGSYYIKLMTMRMLPLYIYKCYKYWRKKKTLRSRKDYKIMKTQKQQGVSKKQIIILQTKCMHSLQEQKQISFYEFS